MKIWEAVQMLEQMDQNKEVIVTFGQPKVKITDFRVPAQVGTPPTWPPQDQTPSWGNDKQFWLQDNVYALTCKDPNASWTSWTSY